jgi:hypothetical protein
MELLNILIPLAVVAVAVWYLYRKIIVRKGCSCGSSDCADKVKKEKSGHIKDRSAL